MTKRMQVAITAILAGVSAFAQQPPTQPMPQPSMGCVSSGKPPVKQHIPKFLQKRIDEMTRKAAQKAGVEIDPKAPEKTLQDAQKTQPCPPVKPQPPAAPPQPPAAQAQQ
jgi:hypothetical protein